MSESDHEVVRAIAVLADPHGIRRLMIVNVYGDESGTHNESTVVTVAAVAIDVDCLVDCAAQWQLALNEYGLRHFHASDFNARRGEYQNLTTSQCVSLSIRLCAIFNRFVVVATCGNLPRSDFDKVKSEFPDLRISHYEFCVYDVIHSLSGWANKHKHIDYMNIVFEAGQPHEGEFITLWRKGITDAEFRERSKIVSLGFESKELVNFFDLCDLASNESYKAWTGFVLGESRQLRKSFASIVGKFDKQSGLFSERNIRDTFRNFSELHDKYGL